MVGIGRFFEEGNLKETAGGSSFTMRVAGRWLKPLFPDA